MAFRPGLNIVLADREPESTLRQTRNRRGKSSLVDVFDFLMGSSTSILEVEPIRDFVFGVEFEFSDAVVRIGRRGSDAKSVYVYDGAKAAWPHQPKEEEGAPAKVLALASWKKILGYFFFGLGHSKVDPEWKSNAPTYRNLISYFIRRDSEGGFARATESSKEQQTAQRQLALSYFLDFDWRIAKRFELVRCEERKVDGLRKENKGLDTAELRTRLALLEKHLHAQEKLLTDFQVVPQFRDLEIEGASLAKNIRQLSDDNSVDRELLEELQSALNTEAPPPPEQIEKLFAEAAVVLPGNVVRRFEDVAAFHASVLRNRRLYLESEAGAASRRIADREKEKVKYAIRRSEVLKVLRSGGALEQHAALHSEVIRLSREVDELRTQFGKAGDYKDRKSALKIEREELQRQLRREFQDRDEAINEAILAFGEISQALYESAGSLLVVDTQNGPEVEIKIHGERSKGINNMQIFCFDMMLVRLAARRKMGPGFLIHDSHLFDGVDARQVASALALGASIASEAGYQYIVTMNSDELPGPELFPEGFDVNTYINDVKLTDAEGGGLFGIEFE